MRIVLDASASSWAIQIIDDSVNPEPMDAIFHAVYIQLKIMA